MQGELFAFSDKDQQLNLFGVTEDTSSPNLKKCVKCERLLHLDCFSTRDRGAYRRTECKDCLSRLAKEVEACRASIGFCEPPEDWKCECCGKLEEQCRGLGGKNNSTWTTDHNHATGKFRGWLCHKCNKALGGFDDDPNLLEKGFSYLITRNEHGPSEAVLKVLKDKGITL